MIPFFCQQHDSFYSDTLFCIFWSKYRYIADNNVNVGTSGPLGHVGRERSPVDTERDGEQSKMTILPFLCPFYFRFSNPFFSLSPLSLSLSRKRNRKTTAFSGHPRFPLYSLSKTNLGGKRNNSTQRNGLRFFSRPSAIRFRFHTLCLPRVSTPQTPFFVHFSNSFFFIVDSLHMIFVCDFHLKKLEEVSGFLSKFVSVDLLVDLSR